MEQGLEIGRRARTLYPAGWLVKDVNLVSATKKTISLMNNPDVTVIFEGAFLVDGFVARADILKRKGDSWHLFEVKSAVNDRAEFIDDMAYTAMVIDCCGVNISDISLLLVSRDFRLGMGNEELFVEIATLILADTADLQTDTGRILPGFSTLANLPTLPDHMACLFAKQSQFTKSN